MAPTVFLIHGLGPTLISVASLAPLEWILKYNGFPETHRIVYPVNESEFDEMVEYVDNEMSKITDRSSKVILIGQSMGGVVANSLHMKGWDIEYAIYIGSPLNGARLINKLDNILPTMIRNLMYKKPYGYLMSKKNEPEPPHQYHTISMSWPGTMFDGCVYRDEATLNAANSTHLYCADHRTVFLDPRLWASVVGLLKKIYDKPLQ